MSDLKTVLETSAARVQYDEDAKYVLTFDMVLANILVLTTKEFEGMDPGEVVKLIEGRPSISTVPMDPGFTNERDADGTIRILGDNNEDRVRYENVNYYDVFFHVRTKNGLSKVYINLEMQKAEPSEYDVEMRGTFYAIREVSSQYGRDFLGKRYNDICPVYSIWIVMNTGEDTIKRIHFAGEDVVGKPRWNEKYDFLNVIIARFKRSLQNDYELKLHRLLGALFIPEVPMNERERILDEEFKVLPLSRTFLI